MQLERILSRIKKYHWWEESCPGVYQFIMYPLRAFVGQCQYFHPNYLTTNVIFSKNDIFYEESPEEEKKSVYDFIFNESQKDKNYLFKKWREADVHKKRFLQTGKYFEKHKKELTNKQFWTVYRDFMLKHYFKHVCYGAAWECVDIFTSYHLESLVKKELPGLTDNKIRDIMRNLATPANFSFMEKERQLFLKICVGLYRQIKKDKEISINKINHAWLRRLQSLSNKYFWIRNTYANTKYLNAEDYFREVKEAVNRKTIGELRQEYYSLKTKPHRLNKEQRKLLGKYRFSADLKLHLYLSRMFGALIDDRKQHMLMANHYINIFCEELARRGNLNIWIVKYYLPEDFKNLLLNNKKLNPTVARARRRFSAYVITKKGQRSESTIFYGRAARRIYDAFFKNQNYKIKSFKGQVASAPVKKITGTAQIIMDAHQEKFTPGNILVTTMTRPEFVPYVRQAKAVITDEGGLTCHAAIISRELKIPCIIGTKIATKVLKDGDRVEVDANQGIVRRLN